jgi:hypothetical protein
LTNHVATLVSIDFFTVPTLTGRVFFVFLLLAFLLLAHHPATDRDFNSRRSRHAAKLTALDASHGVRHVTS